MPTPTNLFLAILFGAIGAAYMIYGKKRSVYFLSCGMALVAYTFFTTDTTDLIWIGVAFTIAPFILTKFLD